MDIGLLKPLLSTLVMPPLSPLLLALLGLLLIGRHKRLGITLVSLACALLWLLACPATSVWLSHTVLLQYPPVSAAQLKAHKVQAIVVLGGGVYAQAPEYGQAQPGPATAARLRYGIWLSRQTSLPLAFSGGIGHRAGNKQQESEAAIAARVASQDYGVSIRWLEGKSRDTVENARMTALLLQREGIRHIALVTDAWHMQRAVITFEQAGFQVAPAATRYLFPTHNALLNWLPSAAGLAATEQVLHEWLGIQVSRWQGT